MAFQVVAVSRLLVAGFGCIEPAGKGNAVAKSRELEQRMSMVATVRASGDARIAFEMELEGPEAEQLLERVQAAPADRVQMVYQQMANNLFAGASEVRGAIDRTPDRTALRLDLTLPGACDVAGDRMVCRGLVVSRPLVPSLASLPERTVLAL